MKCVRDRAEGVIHAAGPPGLLAACKTGFAASLLERLDDAVPNCLWCVTGRESPLRSWMLLSKDDMWRRYIEEHCEG